jgi:hypothetical protein
VQFLDPVLDLAALAVDLFVDPLRRLLQVGNDEASLPGGPNPPAGVTFY